MVRNKRGELKVALGGGWPGGLQESASGETGAGGENRRIEDADWKFGC